MSEAAKSEETQQTAPIEPGPVSSVEHLDPETRALWEAFEAAAGDGEEAAPAAEPPAVEPQPGDEAAPPADPGEPAPQEPPTPPAEQPDVFSDAFEKLREREREIEAKRDELKPLEERIADYEKLNAGWTGDRVGTLHQHVARALGTTDPTAIKKEIDALYEDLTLAVLDVKDESSEAKKARSENMRIKREIEEMKLQREKERQELQREREKADFDRRINEAVTTIDGYLQDAAHDYKHLMTIRNEDAAQVVWNVMVAAREKDPDTNLTIEEAAKLADDELKQLAERFRPLLAPQSEAEQSAQPSKQPVAPPSKPTAPRTLTNAQASHVNTPPPESEFIEDPDEAAKATLARFQSKFKNVT